jgi:DNA-binding winged helix-turn-helix (wHTH) protein
MRPWIILDTAGGDYWLNSRIDSVIRLAPQSAAMLRLAPIDATKIIQMTIRTVARSGFCADASVDIWHRRHNSRRRSSAATAMTPWPTPAKTLQQCQLMHARASMEASPPPLSIAPPADTLVDP